ncbi:lectin like domain-containing protein [Mycoplasma sp. 888]|uniref:lectin like domain-containing protein n=1 Tax=Mycoplasma sp. 888 TaxID=3108483 RepID=UPI002D76E354|nr:lectin like domain-containing protein [Mycoplasma sp. 888]WRQ25662.1 lectin like domain-containing protein [Mycoplasma sp. 888]
MKLKNKKILTSLLVSPSLLVPFSVISATTLANSDAPKLELFQTKTAEEIARMPFFDAREHNLVTSVKNQGHEGLCWAYTIASMLETNILKNNIGNYTKNSLDIDEHAIDYISNSWNHKADKLNLNLDAKEWKGILGDGNHLSHAFNGLMRNTSPIAQTNQTEFPNFDNPTIAKIKNAVKINHTVNDIKLAIAKYGSVGVSYAFNRMNFHPDTVWYNEPNSIIVTKSPKERYIGNHASVIVGWNDDYYVSDFGPETPKQKGGFIIKNSWGTKNMHSQGYFILSYDSLDLLHEVMAVEVENNNVYQNTYYYDTKNSFSLFETIGTNERTMANIFPVKKANDKIVEKLKSINFALKGSNITAEIKIYVKNSLMSNPEDGELKLTQKVQIPNSGDKGFYTIDLKEEIILNKGQYFSIIVDITNKGKKNVDLVASDETREVLSFYKHNNKWENSKKSLVVFGIKAHTLEVPISELNKDATVNEKNKELEESSETNANNKPSESDTENNPPRSDDSKSKSESFEGEVKTDTDTNIEKTSDSEISREEEISSPKTDESETDSSSKENNPISKESDVSNVEDNSSPVAEDTPKNKDITDESSSEDKTNSNSETGTDSESQDNNKSTTEDSATENKDAINKNPTTNESSTIEKNNSDNKKELEDVSIESEKSKTNKTHVILWSILGVTTGIITFGIATFFIVKLMKKRVKK